jgi:hypothetical protein
MRDPLAGMPPIHLKKRGFYCVTAPVKHLKHVPLAMVFNPGHYLSSASTSFASFSCHRFGFCQKSVCHFPSFATSFQKTVQVFVK